MRKLLAGISLAVPCFVACGPQPTTVGSGGSSGSGGSGNSNNPFCAVKTVLQTKCQSCHGSPPAAGVPMSLMSYADTQAPAKSNPSLKVWQLMQSRVGAGTMPPSYAQPVTASDKSTIAAWNGSGSDDCGGGGIVNYANTTTVIPGCTGEQCVPCTITHRFQAHAPGGTGPYQVTAGTTDDYRCFTFNNPFYNTQTQITAETPLVISNPLVVHHWLLFGSFSPPGADGSVSGTACVGPELSDKLLSGWAQGGDAYILPSDIGLSHAQYPYLVLQNHYNNQSGVNATDASGVGYCTTTVPRPNVATVVTLGTDNLMIAPGANNVAGGSGSCDSSVGGTGLAKSGQSVYVIGSSPHMHKLGSGFTTKHSRNGQALADISNVPMGTWKFDGQTKYPLPRVEVKPGDSLVTTCYYTNPGILPVGFGISTTAEMCYDFLLVYPAALTRKECGQGITFDNQ